MRSPSARSLPSVRAWLLEVGPGPGELSARIATELGANVTAVDVSERMVELARGRGVHAQVGDVQSLPFADGAFDTVVAAWMLYHVPDLDRGLAGSSRVLCPGGHLVAVTNSELHLEEARAHARECRWSAGCPSTGSNGENILSRHFAAVERIDVDGWVTFDDAEAIRRYVRSMIHPEAEKADGVPDDVGPVRAGTRVSVFVARRA